MIRGMLREEYFKGTTGPVAALAALCPACGFEHSFRVDLEGHGQWKGDQWHFDGNYDSPTFSPSMHANVDALNELHPVCHSFLENGVWRFLNDCTHEMKNQEVPMIPPDPNMTWRQRHGWPERDIPPNLSY